MTFAPVHLTRAGVSLVLAPAPSGSPAILHWGAALGDLSPADLEALVALHRPGVPHSALDQPRLRGIVGENGSGFTGLPGLEGVRSGGTPSAWAPRLGSWTCAVTEGEDAGVRLEGSDPEAGWAVVVELELTREGVVAPAPARHQRRRGRPPAAVGPRRAAGAGPGGRAARPDRPLVPRADPAAPAVAAWAPTSARAGTAAPATTPRC